MNDFTKHDESSQLSFSDLLCESRVELEGNTEVRSVLSSSDRGQDGVSKCVPDLLDLILDRKNMSSAYKCVKSNKGSCGIDGMSVDKLFAHLKENGSMLIQQIKAGEYIPQAVRRVEIPKPDGGVRLLGIPTVTDRVIQQAIAQVLSPLFDAQFSDSSYGFRKNRRAKQAINKSLEYINAGYSYVVDIDLAKYFDTVNHDILMGVLARSIKDKVLLKLIRKYLQSGVMINGVVESTSEGTPQGGNLSPLLSNIMLNELDKELERRGLRFCRYADDCNIYVRSEKAALRVMSSITRFIEVKLKLKVNQSKSKVGRPIELKFLGFSYYQLRGVTRTRVHPKSVDKLKAKLKEITGRSNAKSMTKRFAELKRVIVGWVNYFAMADFKQIAHRLDEWLRRRIRMCFWKQWKKTKTKRNNLVKLGLKPNVSWMYANTRKSYWRIALSPILATTLNNNYLKSIGFQSILDRYLLKH